MAREELEAMIDQLAALFHDPSTLDPTRDPYGPLRDHRTEALAVALAVPTDDPDPGRRAARADVLGQIVDGHRELTEACTGPLCEMATAEDDPAVLTCIADALAHTASAQVAEPLAGLVRHPHAGVRLAAVRAAGLLADPALHEVLSDLASGRGRAGAEVDRGTLDAALRRCDPGAADAAERVEVALLTTVQASMAESGIEPFDVALTGEYPTTEVVLTRGDRRERHRIWNFDEADPADPTTIDLAFAMNRLANIATWL